MWRAIPLIKKNHALENCLIEIVRPERQGKISMEISASRQKKIVLYSYLQMFVLKSETHVRSIKFHRKVNMCETFPTQVYR